MQVKCERTAHDALFKILHHESQHIKESGCHQSRIKLKWKVYCQCFDNNLSKQKARVRKLTLARLIDIFFPLLMFNFSRSVQ